jgi:hypothetical protein
MKSTLTLDFTNKAANVTIGADTVIKIWGAGLGWSQLEAEGVLVDHAQYIQELQAIGIQTSTVLSNELQQDSQGSGYVIREVERHLGSDTSVALMSAFDDNEIIEKVATYFRLLATLLLGIPPKFGRTFSDQNVWLRVPIDLKPQNIVINEDTLTPILIDTFSPKLWLDNIIKPLPNHTIGKSHILHDEIKVGDIRFSLGRLSGYFMALTTRWLIDTRQESTLKEIDNFRTTIANILIHVATDILLDNNLFERDFALSLIADASEKELASIRLGKYEGPRYVQNIYEQEESPQSL